MMIGGSIIIKSLGAAACIGAIYGCFFDSSAVDSCSYKRSSEYTSTSSLGVKNDDYRQDLSLDIKQQNACSSYINSNVYLDSGSSDPADKDDPGESESESGDPDDESGSGISESGESDDESGKSDDESANESERGSDTNDEDPEDLEDDASDTESTEDGNNDETSENNYDDNSSGSGDSVSDNSTSSDSGENASSGSTHTRTEVIRTVSSGESVESSEPVEYEQGVIDLLSIISGCLIFLVLVVLLKYIYKFFRIFF